MMKSTTYYIPLPGEVHRMHEHRMGRGYLKDRDYYKKREKEERRDQNTKRRNSSKYRVITEEG